MFTTTERATMNKISENRHYEQVAKAIEFITENYQQQPKLEEIASAAGLSAFHFQKLFTEWAGVSPKKFIQYLSVEHAKTLLSESGSNLMDTALDVGLSGSSRLHDLFVNIEGMTPGEFKNGGQNLTINYCFAESLFGKIIVASTQKGICHLQFEEDETLGFENLKTQFPNATYHALVDHYQQQALAIFQRDWSELKNIKLHLAGTDFQLKVWQNLLRIPIRGLSTYGRLAESINNPNAARAVGTAIGRNPVAFIIPCHRVIQSTGALGGYRWGTERKSAMLGWESAGELL
jgi:AraC family transcriptional regulator of adaptative response/methylated-DNA-[protein]-cysteine methyltransferase